MKRVFLLLFSGLLCILLSFSGCGTIPSGSSNFSSEPCISGGGSESVSDSIISTVSVDLSKPMITVISGKETICTYEYKSWGLSWDGNAWVEECHVPMMLSMTNCLLITFSEDFKVQYREDITLKFIKIFDLDEEFYDVPFSELPEGIYYVIYVVEEQGRYIASEKKHESSSYECVFKLVVN